MNLGKILSFFLLGIFCFFNDFPLHSTFAQANEAVFSINYQVIKTYPHDPTAFTQGLVYKDGFFYESTGLHGKSTLRKVDPETGKVLKLYRLPEKFFGEGLTLWKHKLVQLTWRSKTGFVYDRDTFRMIRKFTYPTEGWGITHNGKHLIMSDGTDHLYFLNPRTFKEERRINVWDQNGPVFNLNELEYVKGEIYANVYLTHHIVRISPDTGRVTGWIDLGGLLKEIGFSPEMDVLNGIAYDDKGDRLFVTGKYWPKIFEVRLMGK